jgi:pyrimidine-nucleoside phosphorylase
MIRPADLIEAKRDGREHSPEELAELILAYTRDEVPDYQLAAWCMAVYFRGLTGAETFALTDAMIRSGETLDLGAALGRRVVDKHSTGGVGDKTSIAVGPIVAACGVPVGKMSGRGLGHTGGTLDKLESIPGFRVELSTEEFVAQVREIGLAIVGQTKDLVPADKKLYALRDVTATVDIVPLIASSIMSKKLAAGADAIVLDVKVGDGAFMRTREDAMILAEQDGRSSACSPTWTSRSAAQSGTHSRSARRWRRSAATDRPTSPSSCSKPVRGCSPCPTSTSTSTRVADAPKR